MKGLLSGILVAVASPIALLLGLVFYLLVFLKSKEWDDDPHHEFCPDGWPASPKNDTRIFYPQKKR